MKSLDLILKNKTLPIVNCVAVKGGRGIATNLEQALIFPVSMADGVYDKCYQLTDFALADFPELPDGKMAKVGEISRSEVETLYRASKSCSSNDYRPALTGVMLENGWAVASDGYIMSETLHHLKLVHQIIVPAKTFEILKAMLKDFKVEQFDVYVSDNTISFRAEGVELMSKLIDGNFPDWRKVLGMNRG